MIGRWKNRLIWLALLVATFLVLHTLYQRGGDPALVAAAAAAGADPLVAPCRTTLDRLTAATAAWQRQHGRAPSGPSDLSLFGITAADLRCGINGQHFLLDGRWQCTVHHGGAAPPPLPPGMSPPARIWRGLSGLTAAEAWRWLARDVTDLLAGRW